MNRPGYDKYITKINDDVKEVNFDDYDAELKKIITKNIKTHASNTINLGKGVTLNTIEREIMKMVGWRYIDDYIRSKADFILNCFKKAGVETIYKASVESLKDDYLLEFSKKDYKFIAIKKEPFSSILMTSNLKSAKEYVKKILYGANHLKSDDVITIGFKVEANDSANVKDGDAANEDDTILKAIEKDVLGHVQKGIIEFYNFNNLDKLDDRSPQFLEQFKNVISKNKDKIKSIIQKTNCALIHIQKEYVKKSDLELFTFIQKNLGFKFYVKYYKDVYISNDANEIKKLLNNIYEYGEATSTNVK